MEIRHLMDLLEDFANEYSDYKALIIGVETYFRGLVSSRNSKDKISILNDNNVSLEDAENIQKSTFKLAWQVIIGCISRGKKSSCEQALKTACKLLQMQATLLAPFNTGAFYFPTRMLQGVLDQLLSSDTNNCHLISLFKNYTTYNDVLYYCWQILPIITSAETPSNIYISNYFALLDILPLRKDTNGKNRNEDSSDEPVKVFCEMKGVPRFRFDLNKVQRSMEKTWKCVSSWTLQNAHLHQALLILLERLIRHLPRPVLLTDFLMNAMDVGGAVSTIALQGVFILIQQHNLEYPLVYSKLYSMFETDLYMSQHKSRLYHLTDLFLSSTHLPEALVAGFAKKFSRLAIKFPETDAIILLHMIANLIVRHSGLGKMVAFTNNEEFLFDPYNYKEPDPSLSGAIKSSLWEVADLKNHANSQVAAAAAFALNSHKASMEKPVNEFLDDTTDDLIQEELKRKYKQVYLTTTQPQSIAASSGDRLNDHFDLF